MNRYEVLGPAAAVAAVLLLFSACTTETTGGAALPTDQSATTAAASTSPAPPTTTPGSGEVSLDDVQSCSLLDPASLPAAWGSIIVDDTPLVTLGASDCDIYVSGSGLGLTIAVYRGPGQGIDELSKTTASTPTPTTVAGRSARIYRDSTSNNCGILFDFGADQSVTLAASPPRDGSLDSCDIATTAATAMAPNLPPS